jgi:hypothetical protein
MTDTNHNPVEAPVHHLDGCEVNALIGTMKGHFTQQEWDHMLALSRQYKRKLSEPPNAKDQTAGASDASQTP